MSVAAPQSGGQFGNGAGLITSRGEGGLQLKGGGHGRNIPIPGFVRYAFSLRPPIPPNSASLLGGDLLAARDHGNALHAPRGFHDALEVGQVLDLHHGRA